MKVPGPFFFAGTAARPIICSMPDGRVVAILAVSSGRWLAA